MSKYEELQVAHQRLLEQSENTKDAKEMLDDVQAYIDQIKTGAEYVPDPRERNQLRANLRYWASFIYDQTGNYPNTNMRPASMPSTGLEEVQPFPKPGRRTFFVAVSIISGIIIIFIFTFWSNDIDLLPSAGISLSPTPEDIAHTAQFTSLPTYTPQLPSPTMEDVLIPLSGPSLTPTPSAIIASTTPTPTTKQQTPSVSQTTAPTLDPTAIVLLNTDVAVYSDSGLVLLPATGGGGFTSIKTNMNAMLVYLGEPEENCRSRVLTISLDPIDLFSESDLGASVELSHGGRVVAAARLPFKTGTISFYLPNSTSDAAVLVQINQPLLLFETVIAQFYNDCSRNRLFLYYMPNLDEELSHEFPSDLQFSWRMLTWGPSPDGTSWIATLLLDAHGGDGNYIFWALGDAVNAIDNGLLLDNRLLVSKEFCEPARLRLGVTSAGLTTQRDLVLQAPSCLEILVTPVP